MSAKVIHVDFKAARARRIALAKAEMVRSLAEELAAYLPGEARAMMGCYYIQMGWANPGDVKLALEVLGETE